MAPGLPLSHGALQVPPNAVQLLYCLRSHSCQTFEDACDQFFHLWHKLQQLREWVTQLDSYTHQHFCATPELHQYKPRLAEEYLTAKPENLDGKQLDETVPLMLGIPSQGCFTFQLLQLFCRCQANLVLGTGILYRDDLMTPKCGVTVPASNHPLQECPHPLGSRSEYLSQLKATQWISMNDKRNWCCNILSMIISVLPYEFILLSWTLHQVYSLSSYFFVFTVFKSHYFQQLNCNSAQEALAYQHMMSWSEPRPTTNNQQRSWGLCQKRGALLPWSTNKWCNQLLIPTYHVFPTCKPNTKKSNSKVKTEPSEASKPFKLDQHTVVCSYHVFFAPHAIRLWKQDISHENCRPFCTVHFAGGEPVSATSLVRAPLKHLGLHARILFWRHQNQNHSHERFFGVSLVPGMLKR